MNSSSITIYPIYISKHAIPKEKNIPDIMRRKNEFKDKYRSNPISGF